MSDVQLGAAIAELGPHLGELCFDLFGNYVVSCLSPLPLAQPKILASMKGRVVELLQHAQGSRALQAALSALPPRHAAELVSEIDGYVLECALSANGSWGLVAAYKCTHSNFILEQLAQHICALATQQNGCRVLQRVLGEAATCGLSIEAPVRALLEGGVAHLAQHSFGNYVVQVALRHGPEHLRSELVAALLPVLGSLSKGKHGSNVAEMLLERASGAQMEQAANQLSGLGDHPFAGYVVQTLNRCREQSSTLGVAMPACVQ